MGIEIGYWKIRGLAQPIRYLLEYIGQPFNDVRYAVVKNEQSGWDRTSWNNVKEEIGCSFPNLPYYKDGDLKISQSNAILRSIARKYKPELLGTDLKIQCEVDMTLDVVMDLRNALVRLAYSGSHLTSNWKEEVEKFKNNTVLIFFKRFEQCFSSDNRKYFNGPNLTLTDFHFYEMVYQIKALIEDDLKDFPHVLRVMKNFEELPAIQKNIEKYSDLPFNNPSAWNPSK